MCDGKNKRVWGAAFDDFDDLVEVDIDSVDGFPRFATYGGLCAAHPNILINV